MVSLCREYLCKKKYTSLIYVMTITRFFFYHKLKNIELVKKLDPQCDCRDGRVLIEDFDEQSGRLHLGNNTLLSGKLVTFNHSLSTILDKINDIHPMISIDNKPSYEISKILVDQGVFGACEAYIIH